MSAKVVLLEQLGDGLDDATLASFGEVRVMFGRQGARCPSVFHTDEFISAVRTWFQQHFDPSTDYFVVAGRATKIAIALAQLVQMHGDRYAVRVLIYDGSVRGYVERIF